MTTRQRFLVYGAGGTGSLVAGCYGWHPLLCTAVGLVTCLLAGAVIDDHRRRQR